MSTQNLSFWAACCQLFFSPSVLFMEETEGNKNLWSRWYACTGVQSLLDSVVTTQIVVCICQPLCNVPERMMWVLPGNPSYLMLFFCFWYILAAHYRLKLGECKLLKIMFRVLSGKRDICWWSPRVDCSTCRWEAMSSNGFATDKSPPL